MKPALWLTLALVWPLCACAQSPDSREDTANVNSRYIVESVKVTGYPAAHVSRALRNDLDKLVGEKLNHSLLDRMAGRLKHELQVPNVAVRVLRGTKPDEVAVNFEIEPEHEPSFGMSVPSFAYESKEGWSGAYDVTTRIQGNDFTFGLVSNGDALAERYAGIHARYERKNVGADRLGLRFEFDSYHEQWNLATLDGLNNYTDIPGAYRTRQEFAPTATVALAGPLTFSAGVAFDRFRPEVPAASTESANAVVSTLRYQQGWEDSETNKHELEAGYTLRAATKVFESDFVYVRHEIAAAYTFTRDRSRVLVNFKAGRETGNAPLYDRFILGNASTLRGWNKFDLDPLGGNRMVYGSLEYQYRWFQVFYDTGAVWDQHSSAEQNQSLGVGAKMDNFLFALAFPIRAGCAAPMLIAGMNF